MEQRVVVKNENQCIYFMRESNFEFYLLIPNCRNVKIVLGLFEDVNDDFVKNLPVQKDLAVVVPVIKTDILRQANVAHSSSYNYLNQVLSFLINTAYKMLTYNHIEVENQILLNSNSKLELFNQNFISKYQGRVQLINLFPEKVQLENNDNVMEEVYENKENIIPDDIVPTEISALENVSRQDVKEPGFVSYVLLGVLVAVLSLVFLYFII